MDALIPGHAHRSSSDRLLNNYLDSQKSLTAALLTLLSHSHTSTSSLLAYVTSSPGVLLSVRRAVKHAAFEGPISSSTHETHSTTNGDTGATPGWAAYVSSLEDFRRDLKQIHLLEEEMSRVKRDREILVTRLIKTTKSRPTKSDIKAMADTLAPRDASAMSSSGASVYSHNSDVSATTRETKRASKLAEAQAELLGCEEHLRSLEVRIEHERNKVMYRGLEERFRSMEAVGQMWITQARRGLADLDKLPDLPHNAFELDSNGSIAPSQSASQVGYEDGPAAVSAAQSKRPANRHVLGMRVPEQMNMNGSIAEEEEGGSSDEDEPQGTLVMHENRPPPQANGTAKGRGARMSSPVLAVTSAPSIGQTSANRRATSDLGAIAPYSPQKRAPLRRTVSNEHVRAPSSETSSIRSVKKKGFFSSIARFFKGPKRTTPHGRSGRASPTRGTWSTRTDHNLKRSSGTVRRRRSDSSSSSDDDRGNLVGISNSNNINREFGGWSVADIGRDTSSSRPGVKRSASARSKSTVMTQSTVTARRPFSPTIPPQTTLPPISTSQVSRSNTVKTAKSTGTAGERTRKNGSIARSKSTASKSTASKNNLKSIADMPPPAMPDVPRAPQSQLNPRMELAKAPGSSIVPTMNGDASMLLPADVVGSMSRRQQHDDELRPQDSISRSNSTRSGTSKPKTKTKTSTKRNSLHPEKALEKAPEKSQEQYSDAEERRPVSPLPPSKLRSPPLKSALRPTSPAPVSPSSPPPVITTLYSITAPGPVELPAEPEPEVQPEFMRPRPKSRGSYGTTGTTGGDETSVYESATEDATGRDAEDESDDDDETELGRYTVVANDIAAVADKYKNSPPNVPVPLPPPPKAGLEDMQPTANGHETIGEDGAKIVRRKSVRMNLPEDGPSGTTEQEREQERERAFADAAVAAHPTGVHHSHPIPLSASAPPRPPRRSDSPPIPRQHANWDTRIGRVRDDSSDEENPLTKEYTKARKGLIRNTGDFSDVTATPKKGLRKSLSLKSKGKRAQV